MHIYLFFVDKEVWKHRHVVLGYVCYVVRLLNIHTEVTYVNDATTAYCDVRDDCTQPYTSQIPFAGFTIEVTSQSECATAERETP